MTHRFVELIPDVLEDDVLYISLEYSTAIHKCVCGCGNQVVTPLSPTGWQLLFDGDTVSLSPSIGCWEFSCKSHYWIIKNKIKYARKWSNCEVEKNRKLDQQKEKKKNNERVSMKRYPFKFFFLLQLLTGIVELKKQIGLWLRL